MEAAPHLPRWMSGQCKLLRELLGGLGEEWVAEDMEGVEGGEGGGVDSDIVLADPEDGGTPYDKFAWGIRVGMVGKQREYGAKWGGSKKRGGGGQQMESQAGGEGALLLLCSRGFIGGWRWRCTGGSCALRHWEATPSGSLWRASLANLASGASKRG